MVVKTEKREKVERERERNGFMEFNFNGDPIPGFRMEFHHMLGAFCISTGHSQFPAKKCCRIELRLRDFEFHEAIVVFDIQRYSVLQRRCSEAVL